MKKLLIFLLFIICIYMNAYLILYWQPSSNINNSLTKATISYSKVLYRYDNNNTFDEIVKCNEKEFEPIFNKLSSIDVGKIKEFEEYEDKNKSIIAISKLLKIRISKEEYSNIKKIMDNYFYMDEVEKNI